MTVLLEPKESQDLYDFVLNNRGKLPPIHNIRNVILTADQLEEIYDIVATNRAKTRGTRLYFETNDDGDVSKIEYAEIKIPPENIITPRIKECPHCHKRFENALAQCPNCGKDNER
jgi:hypothetical protein